MPRNPHEFVQRGKALIARRQYQEAAKVCRLGLLGQPTSVDGRLVLGQALLALSRYEEVLSEMRVVLDLDPLSVEGWLVRGEALSLKGHYTQAETALLRAQELAPRNPHIDRLLADVRMAIAAGLGGDAAEPTSTEEYSPQMRVAAELDLEAAAAAEGDPSATGQVTLPEVRVGSGDVLREKFPAVATLIDRRKAVQTTDPRGPKAPPEPPTLDDAPPMRPAPALPEEEEEGEDHTTGPATPLPLDPPPSAQATAPVELPPPSPAQLTAPVTLPPSSMQATAPVQLPPLSSLQETGPSRLPPLRAEDEEARAEDGATAPLPRVAPSDLAAALLDELDHRGQRSSAPEEGFEAERDTISVERELKANLLSAAFPPPSEMARAAALADEELARRRPVRKLAVDDPTQDGEASSPDAASVPPPPRGAREGTHEVEELDFDDSLGDELELIDDAPGDEPPDETWLPPPPSSEEASRPRTLPRELPPVDEEEEPHTDIRMDGRGPLRYPPPPPDLDGPRPPGLETGDRSLPEVEEDDIGGPVGEVSVFRPPPSDLDDRPHGPELAALTEPPPDEEPPPEPAAAEAPPEDDVGDERPTGFQVTPHPLPPDMQSAVVPLPERPGAPPPDDDAPTGFPEMPRPIPADLDSGQFMAPHPMPADLDSGQMAVPQPIPADLDSGQFMAPHPMPADLDSGATSLPPEISRRPDEQTPLPEFDDPAVPDFQAPPKSRPVHVAPLAAGASRPLIVEPSPPRVAGPFPPPPLPLGVPEVGMPSRASGLHGSPQPPAEAPAAAQHHAARMMSAVVVPEAATIHGDPGAIAPVPALQPPQMPTQPPAPSPPTLSRGPAWLATRRGVVILAVGGVLLLSAVATATGMLLREFRGRARVARRLEAARDSLLLGTYAGHRAAAEEYRRLLQDRPDDDRVRAARARALSAIALEFGDPVEEAAREVSLLGTVEGEDAHVARVLVALVRGDLTRAQRLASEAPQTVSPPLVHYLSGRLSLARNRFDEAARDLARAAEKDPRDPLMLRALALAEAGRHRDAAALEALGKALVLSPHQPASLIERALLLARSGKDLRSAEIILDEVVTKLELEASPVELARAHVALAQIRLTQGRLASAKALLARAAAKRPEGSPVVSRELAAAYLQSSSLAAAEGEARMLLASPRPADVAAGYLVLAQVALARGRPREAQTHSTKGDTSQPETLITSGLARLALGDVRAARADLDAAQLLAPEATDVRSARARVLIAEGNAAAAARDMELIERAQRGTADVAETLALARRAQGQPDRARYWLGKALERSPAAVTPHIELARLLHEEGHLDEARAELKRTSEAHPDHLGVRRELAALALEAGDARTARQEYDALVRERADDVEALLGSARAMLIQGETALALDRLRAAETAGASGEELAVVKAAAALQGHRPEEALVQLRPIAPRARRAETAALLIVAAAEAKSPLGPNELARLIPASFLSSPEVTIAQARTMADAGQWARAEALASSVVTAGRGAQLPPPLRAEAYLAVGRAMHGQGQTAKALRWLDVAVKLDPRNARAAFYLAAALDASGRRDLALASLEQAASIDPALARAQYELGRLRAAAGDPRAREALEAYLRLEPDGMFADAARAFLGRGDVPPPRDTPAPAPRKHRRRR